MKVHVAIINLVFRKSRRVRIAKLVSQLRAASEFTAHPIVSVNIVEAVDGVTQSFPELEQRYGLKPMEAWAMDDPENRYPSSWRTPQTSGGIASGLSHLDIAALAVDAGWLSDNDNYVLVMEDDCVVSSSPEAAYSHFLNCLSEANRCYPQWELLMLGAAGHRPDIAPSQAIPGAAYIEIAGFSYLTTMYWLSARGCKKLNENRKLCVEHCLAFDELHNALAGLTVREDVRNIYSESNLVGGRLELVSAIHSLVRQDPHDCVHDTAATNLKNRRKSDFSDDEADVLPPTVSSIPVGVSAKFELEKMEGFSIGGQEGIVWYRRRPSRKLRTRTDEEWRSDFGFANKRNPEKKKVKISFGLMATLMNRRKARVDSDIFPPAFDWNDLKV